MAAPHDDKDAHTLLDKIRNEKFVEKDLVFFVADSASAKAAIGAAAKKQRKVAGLVLIRPSEELTNSKNMHKYGKEACIVNSNENAQILEYLESLGALK